MAEHVFISGPASWNRLVYLDHLPEPVPHMQFATEEYETLGGTSAGKALGLAGLGRPVVLHTLLGTDPDGERVRRVLTESGIRLLAPEVRRHRAPRQSHDPRRRACLPLPLDADLARGVGRRRTDDGDDGCRSPGARPLGAQPRPVARGARHRACRSGPTCTTTTARASSTGRSSRRPTPSSSTPIACRAIRGTSSRRPCSAGASLAVCTLGSRGAIAVSASDQGMRRHEVAAVPVVVRDTNGAGDAFMSAVLDARLAGADVDCRPPRRSRARRHSSDDQAPASVARRPARSLSPLAATPRDAPRPSTSSPAS